MKSSYEILGVERNAPIEEIKMAYKHLTKECHPDTKNGSNEKFLELKEAYEELSNPKIKNMSGLANIFGLEMWEKLVKYEDFNISREIASLGRWIEWDEDTDKEDEKNYKKYRWTKNKLKLLDRLYMKLQSSLYYYKNEINVQIIKNHLKRLLNDEIDIKEKIQKPTILNEPNILDYDHRTRKRISKIEYDTQNQFHPKFINKLPMKIQIFINNKIKDFLLGLQKV